MTHRLITYKQVEDLLIYGYEKGRVFKNPSECEVMQGFNSLPEIDTEGIIECLEGMKSTLCFKDGELNYCHPCGHHVDDNVEGWKHDDGCLVPIAEKFIAQLRKD